MALKLKYLWRAWLVMACFNEGTYSIDAETLKLDGCPFGKYRVLSYCKSCRTICPDQIGRWESCMNFCPEFRRDIRSTEHTSDPIISDPIISTAATLQNDIEHGKEKPTQLRYLLLLLALLLIPFVVYLKKSNRGCFRDQSPLESVDVNQDPLLAAADSPQPPAKSPRNSTRPRTTPQLPSLNNVSTNLSMSYSKISSTSGTPYENGNISNRPKSPSINKINKIYPDLTERREHQDQFWYPERGYSRSPENTTVRSDQRAPSAGRVAPEYNPETNQRPQNPSLNQELFLADVHQPQDTLMSIQTASTSAHRQYSRQSSVCSNPETTLDDSTHHSIGQTQVSRHHLERHHSDPSSTVHSCVQPNQLLPPTIHPMNQMYRHPAQPYSAMGSNQSNNNTHHGMSFVQAAYNQDCSSKYVIGKYSVEKI